MYFVQLLYWFHVQPISDDGKEYELSQSAQ